MKFLDNRLFQLMYSFFTACMLSGCPSPDEPEHTGQSQSAYAFDRNHDDVPDRCELEYLVPGVWSSASQSMSVYTRVWCEIALGEPSIPRVRVTMTDPDRGIYDEETNTCPARAEVYRGPQGLYQPIAFDAQRPGLHEVTLAIENADTGEALGGDRILYLLSQLTVPRDVVLGPQRTDGIADSTIRNWLGGITDELLQRCADGDASCAVNHALVAFCVLQPELCPKTVGVSAGVGVLLESLTAFVENDSHIRPETRPLARTLLSIANEWNSFTGISKFGGILTGEPAEIATFAAQIDNDASLSRFISQQEALAWFGWNVDGALTEVRPLGTNLQALVIRATREDALDSGACLYGDYSTRSDLALVIIVNTSVSGAGTPAEGESEGMPCAPDWSCSMWSSCSCTGVRARTCTDTNACGTTTDRPALTSTCSACGNISCDCGETCTTCSLDCGVCPLPSCTPVWDCTDWTPCRYCPDTRRRDCTDRNSCGTTAGRPPTSRPCDECGDGCCEGEETCDSCSLDCGSCPPPPGPGCSADYPYACNGTCSSCEAGYTLCCPTTGTPNWCCGAGNICMADGACCAPSPEVCNGVDDNCDGVVDEGCPSPSGPTCSNGVCEAGETCASCESDCGMCPPPDPGSGCLSYEICGDEVDDNCNGDLWDGCACRPIYGQNTRCVDGRYVEGCNRGNWRRDQDCLTEAWGCPENTGSCVFVSDYAGCACR